MQIISLAVYNRQGDIRPLNFHSGKLNILTGKSQTGKSTVLDIVDFCLGRDEVELPGGRALNAVSWFALIVEVGETRILIARPNPETASNSRAMLKIGTSELTFPPMTDLQINANTTVLRDQLSEWVGVEQYTIETVANSLRASFDVSIRQALFMCFQKQTEISSQRYLFHRQSDRNVQDAIKDTLPYFLGVTGPEEASLRRRTLAARRALARAERDLITAREEHASYDSRIEILIEEARALGLMNGAINGERIDLLRDALGVDIDISDTIESDSEEIASSRSGLLRARSGLRSNLRRVDEELDLLRQIISEEQKVTAEATVQSDRLAALGLFSVEDSGDNGRCPICTQSLDNPDPRIADLVSLQQALHLSLNASTSSRPRRESEIQRLEEQRSEVVEQLRVNSLSIAAADATERSLADTRNLRERRIFLKGRISQELGGRSSDESVVSSLEREVEQRRQALSILEQKADSIDIESSLRDVLNSIGDDMTEWARRLDLEHSEGFVRLDMGGPNVVALTPGGRRALTNIGSAKNWIGYHLVAHMALHKWFAENFRPVPRFVMFDQPSQGFFPEQVSDATELEDADWGPVRQQFMLLRDVVDTCDGAIQVIVCDHANFTDGWFQDCLIENWRDGQALIPESWIEAERKN
jgi:hypothetical protein